MSAIGIAQLQQRIHAGIPLSRAMGYRIASLSENAIVVEAPIAPNVNVHETVFAGSLFALGILTAWGLVTHILEKQRLDVALVVVQANIRYRSPVASDIVCLCEVDKVAAEALLDR